MNGGLDQLQLPASVSVLIPAHNAGSWLNGAVRSALQQQGVRVDVIVCDDGSTDESLATLNEFKSSALTILRQPQRGGGVARNALLAATRSDWVQFLDADDYLEPEKIHRQFVEGKNGTDADVLYSPVWLETWRDGQARERVASPIAASSDLFTQWFTWQLPQTGGPLWRTEALRRIGGWNESVPCCQEHELYLRALQSDLRWRFCPSPGAVYRVWSEDTVSRKDPLRVIRMRSELTENMLAWLARHNRLLSVHTAAAGQAFFELARTWARHDLDGATAFFDEHQRRDLIRVHGPAAPMMYRMICRSLGFRPAELLARGLR